MGRGHFLPSSTSSWFLLCLESQLALVVKNPPANAGGIRDMGLIPELGRSHRGGNGNKLHYFTWRIVWTEETGRLQSIKSQRVRHSWSDLACLQMEISPASTSTVWALLVTQQLKKKKKKICPQCRRCRRYHLIPGLGRSWRKAWQPTAVLLFRAFHGQRPQDWKSVFIPIPKKGNVKECSNYPTTALISHTSKVILKILQVRIQQYVNHELPDVPARFRKGRRTRYQIANILWITEKLREFQKNIYFWFIDYVKAFDCMDHNKLLNNRPPYLPPEKSVCRSGSKS